MSVQLYQGDCLEVLRGMADKSIGCIVTDPPYGIGESRAKVMSRGKLATPIDYGDFVWDKERLGRVYFDEMRRVSAEQIFFGGNYYTDYLPASASWIVWDKVNGSNDFADCELAWTSHKKAVRQYTYMWNGMIKQMPEERFHPTQKPLSLMIWVLENYTKPNDLVLDPFMGSGTTLIAAHKTGRRFMGCERDSNYFAIAQKRIAEAQMQIPLFEVA